MEGLCLAIEKGEFKTTYFLRIEADFARVREVAVVEWTIWSGLDCFSFLVLVRLPHNWLLLVTWAVHRVDHCDFLRMLRRQPGLWVVAVRLG